MLHDVSKTDCPFAILFDIVKALIAFTFILSFLMSEKNLIKFFLGNLKFRTCESIPAGTGDLTWNFQCIYSFIYLPAHVFRNCQVNNPLECKTNDEKKRECAIKGTAARCIKMYISMSAKPRLGAKFPWMEQHVASSMWLPKKKKRNANSSCQRTGINFWLCRKIQEREREWGSERKRKRGEKIHTKRTVHWIKRSEWPTSGGNVDLEVLWKKRKKKSVFRLLGRS